MYVLAILWMTVKRIWSNWRLEAALLAGLILAVGIVSAIPIYTSGALQKSLFEQWLRQSESRPPLGLMMTHSNTDFRIEAEAGRFEEVRLYLERELPRAIGAAPRSTSRAAELGTHPFVPERPGARPARTPYANLKTVVNMKELVSIIDGRWYGPRDDGRIEAVVDTRTLEELELLVGEAYVYEYRRRNREGATDVVRIPVEVVGVIEPDPATRTTEHWIYPPPFTRTLFVDPDLFHQVFLEEMGLAPSAYDWYQVFDYRTVRVHELDRITADLERIQSRVGQMLPGTRFWLSPLSLFRWFNQRAGAISAFLVSLSVPIIGMVLYYIVLIAGLTVERRRNEIAVLHSRGAGRVQIVTSFLLEWLLLAALALLLGPQVGLFISRAMGASSGFLAFVNREALPVSMSDDAFRYGVYAALLAVGAAMIPAIRSSRHSIVSFKLQLARGAGVPVWQRFYADLALIGVSAYGYRALGRESRLAADAGEVAVLDPLLLFVPLLFLLGAGLFLLRIYPWVMSGLAWAFSHLPGVVWSLTLRQLSRSSGQIAPLLLLLLLTVSLGIYTASAARTLDQYFVDQVRYWNGADITLSEQWTLPGGEPPAGGAPGAPPGPGSVPDSRDRMYEPPFYLHQELPGVEAAARALRLQVNARAGGRFLAQGSLLGIVPPEFGRVAWHREDLFPLHFYTYLNILARHREGALVTPAFLERSNLSPGDFITLEHQGQPIDVYIAGAVRYWPTLDPDHPFFIVNLEHVQESIALQPYDVWLKMSGTGHLGEIVERLREEGIYVIRASDAWSQIVAGRNQPHRMGFFGILSIGFIVSSIVTVLGFTLYTFLSMRSRLLHFGVLRAVGLSVRQLVAILTLEQALSLGTGLVAGAGLGALATRIFLPFLREDAAPGGGAPPFLIVTDPGDFQRIFIVLGTMLVIAVVGLGAMLARMKLHQAIKLGEEA